MVISALIDNVLLLASNTGWYMGVALMGGLKYEREFGCALALASYTVIHTT